MQKDFWSNSKVAVIGGGSWGTVLANLTARNCREVRVWLRSEDQAREMNSTRRNERYAPGLALHERVHAMSDPGRRYSGRATDGPGANGFDG